MKLLLTVVSIALFNVAAFGQMISPVAGVTYTTPTNVVVELTNGCQISQVRLYKYRTDNNGVEHREYYRSDYPGSVTNVYSLNPNIAPWFITCGDYDVQVVYTVNNDNNYQTTASGKIRIMTDRSAIHITYPTRYSVLTRGTPITVRWEVLAKPGNEGMIVCLQTPNGESCSDFAELALSGDHGVTNTVAWTVFTNTSIPNTTVTLPNGEYSLAVFPANEYEDLPYSSGFDRVYFRIDSEQTTPISLSQTISNSQAMITLSGNQSLTRYWNLEVSTNLADWSTLTDSPLGQGNTFTRTTNAPKEFFRAKLVP